MDDRRVRNIELKGDFLIPMKIGRVFPLFSPLGERSWVPGWNPEIVHPPEAEWEEDMVFRSGGTLHDAVWTVTRLDVSTFSVSYFRVEGTDLTAHIDVECRPVSAESTEVSVRYAFVALSEKGESEIETMSQGDYDQKMIQWKRWIEDRQGLVATSE